MNSRYRLLLRWMDLLGGLFILNMAFVIAVSIRFDDLRVENPTYYNYYLQLWLFFNLLWVLLRISRLWQSDLLVSQGIRKRIGRSLLAILAHVMALALLVLLLKGTFFSRLFGLYFYSTWALGAVVWELVFYRFQMALVKRGLGLRRIALIGSGRAFQEAIDRKEELQDEGWQLVSILNVEDITKSKRLSSDALRKELSRGSVDELFIASDDAGMTLAWERIADSYTVRVRLLPKIELPGERIFRVEYAAGMPLLLPRAEPLELVHNRLLKRLIDLVMCSLVLLLVYPWAFPLIALLVKISGVGSVFYVQERTGLRDEHFKMIKFRSMRSDGQVTRIGRFIRRYSLDELPQFINVLRGDMSVVGPRPHMLEHTGEYRKRLDDFMLRHLIHPGLTGLAQVQGHRGKIEAPEELEARVRADVYYLENWSVLLDLKIIVLTIFQLVFPVPKAR